MGLTKQGEGPCRAPLITWAHFSTPMRPCDIDIFTADHQFHKEVDQAVQTLGDPGLIAEVHHFWTLETLWDSILKQE